MNWLLHWRKIFHKGWNMFCHKTAIFFFCWKVQNFMQFPPHDFHQIFPAGHAYTHEGIAYNILVFHINYISQFLRHWHRLQKSIRKMHSVLNARWLQQQCRYITFSLHREFLYYSANHTYIVGFEWVLHDEIGAFITLGAVQNNKKSTWRKSNNKIFGPKIFHF